MELKSRSFTSKEPHVAHEPQVADPWSRKLGLAGHVARMEEGRSTLKILAVKPTGKRPLGRPRRRWKDNIRMDLKEIDINMSYN